MATGRKSSTLPNNLRHTGSPKIFSPNNKGFLGKIRQKLRFGNKRQYSFEEQDGVVLTGVYSRRASEESPNWSHGRKMGSDHIQPNGNAYDHHNKNHNVVYRTPGNTLSVSDILPRHSEIANSYTELTQEERRKSLVVERESGLFSAALNLNDLQNDMLVPDDSAIDLDQLQRGTNLYKQSVVQDDILEDIDPGYETLEEVRKRIADQMKNSDNQNLKTTDETCKKLYESVNSDQLKDGSVCSPGGGQDITRDSGLGSPGCGEEGIEVNFLQYGLSENRMDESTSGDDSVLCENTQAMVNNQNSVFSHVFEEGGNRSAWNSAQTKDIYDNPQVLFRKQSYKMAQSVTSAKAQLTASLEPAHPSGMFVKNVSDCAIDDDVKDSSVFHSQRISVDLEGPPLPARNYSMYIDKERTKMNDPLKSESKNKGSIKNINYIPEIIDKANKPEIKKSEEEQVAVLEVSDVETQNNMSHKNSMNTTNSVITTTVPCPSNTDKQLFTHTSVSHTSNYISPESLHSSNNLADQPSVGESDGTESIEDFPHGGNILNSYNDLQLGSCLQNVPLVFNISNQSCDHFESETVPVDSMVVDLPSIISKKDPESNFKRDLENSSIVNGDQSPRTFFPARNCSENWDSLNFSKLLDSNSDEQCSEAHDNSEHIFETQLKSVDMNISFEPLDTHVTSPNSSGLTLERQGNLTNSQAQQQIIYMSPVFVGKQPDVVEAKTLSGIESEFRRESCAESENDESLHVRNTEINEDFPAQAEVNNKLDDSATDASNEHIDSNVVENILNPDALCMMTISDKDGSDKLDDSDTSTIRGHNDLNAGSEMLSNNMSDSFTAVTKDNNIYPQAEQSDKLDVTQCSNIAAEEDQKSDCMLQCPILNDQNDLIGVQGHQNKIDEKVEVECDNIIHSKMETSRQNAVFEDSGQISFMSIGHEESLSLVLAAEGTEDEPIHMCLSEINWEKLHSYDDTDYTEINGEMQNNSTSPPACPMVPPRRPRKKNKTTENPQYAFIESMRQLKDCGWYWGPLSWDEAESTLSDKTDGSFLVRDSSDDRYILSLSFKSQSGVHHTRIEHHKGKFSFWSQPDSHSRGTIKEFVNQCIENSRDGRFLYFIRPSRPGYPPIPIHLKNPISRFMQIQSLHHLCRFSILQAVRRDYIDELPVPQRVKDYLKRPQYYVEMENDEI